MISKTLEDIEKDIKYLKEIANEEYFKKVEEMCNEANEHTKNTININKKLQERIDKAIEYIKKCTENEINTVMYKGKEYHICASDFNEGAEIILDILKGDNNE